MPALAAAGECAWWPPLHGERGRDHAAAVIALLVLLVVAPLAAVDGERAAFHRIEGAGPDLDRVVANAELQALDLDEEVLAGPGRRDLGVRDGREFDPLAGGRREHDRVGLREGEPGAPGHAVVRGVLPAAAGQRVVSACPDNGVVGLDAEQEVVALAAEQEVVALTAA